MCVLVAQLCLTFCDPMDCSPLGFSVHGILQTRILEFIAFPSPGDLSDPGIELGSPALQVDSFLSDPPRKPYIHTPIYILLKYLFIFLFIYINIFYILSHYDLSQGKLLNQIIQGISLTGHGSLNLLPPVLP